MKEESADPTDPFRAARREGPVFECEFQGKSLPMILRHADVRSACKDWGTYSSDAPMRVPIPSEEDVRSVRQLPVEIDPPEHGDYRALVEPFFQRPKNNPEMIAKTGVLIEELLRDAAGKESVEVVRDFALPLQSRALTYMLQVPESEAETWIGWGTHVFRDGDDGSKKGATLDAYLNEAFDRAEGGDGSDFFSALSQSEFRGRKLTRDECLGFANLTFAGGRDTIINSVAYVIAYLARNPQAIEFLREDPKRIVHASEEFFRALTPLTNTARICPVETDVHGVSVPADERVALCWASANRDEDVFDAPEEVRLDRKPNPHIAFGFGTHLCLGAPQARLIVRTLLQKIIEKPYLLTFLDAVENVEHESRYERAVAYGTLHVAFS